MTEVPHDALLLVSFGGPERPEDVIPFLENVTRGRGVSKERLAEVAEHYYLFGGSPISQQCRDLVAAIRRDFSAHGLDLPVYWGNRNWYPHLADTLQDMAGHGVRRAIAFVTAAYSSYPSCRQYRENIASAQAAVGDRAPAIDRLRHYFNHPGFIQPMIDNTRYALESWPPDVRDRARLVFTAHSIPTAMSRTSGPDGNAYVRQLREVAELIAGGRPFDLAFQSRSGPPNQEWLGPDVCDRIDQVRSEGVDAVAVVPIGFVSDHLEVIYDLDVVARGHAERLGIKFARVATVGTDPRFVAMVRELILERVDPERKRASLGRLGPSHDVCPANCCPNPRGRRPAIAEGIGV